METKTRRRIDPRRAALPGRDVQRRAVIAEATAQREARQRDRLPTTPPPRFRGFVPFDLYAAQQLRQHTLGVGTLVSRRHSHRLRYRLLPNKPGLRRPPDAPLPTKITPHPQRLRQQWSLQTAAQIARDWLRRDRRAALREAKRQEALREAQRQEALHLAAAHAIPGSV